MAFSKAFGIRIGSDTGRRKAIYRVLFEGLVTGPEGCTQAASSLWRHPGCLLPPSFFVCFVLLCCLLETLVI